MSRRSFLADVNPKSINFADVKKKIESKMKTISNYAGQNLNSGLSSRSLAKKNRVIRNSSAMLQKFTPVANYKESSSANRYNDTASSINPPSSSAYIGDDIRENSRYYDSGYYDSKYDNDGVSNSYTSPNYNNPPSSPAYIGDDIRENKRYSEYDYNNIYYNDNVYYPSIKSNNGYTSFPPAKLSNTNSLIRAYSDNYIANELTHIRRELHRIDIKYSKDMVALLNVLKNCKIYIS